MGQQEVFTFLKRNSNKWFTTRQIAERLKTSFGSVTTNLKILRESKQVNCEKTIAKFHRLGRRAVFVYKFKK